MKAKIKECNMIVDVEHQNLGEKGSDISFWCESLDKSFSRYELDFDYNKSKATAEIDWEQRRWDVHRDSYKIAMNVILMAQFEVSKSDPDLAKQIDWKKMAEASMEFVNEVSQGVVESYQLKQQNNEK